LKIEHKSFCSTPLETDGWERLLFRILFIIQERVVCPRVNFFLNGKLIEGISPSLSIEDGAEKFPLNSFRNGRMETLAFLHIV
jgi:hypothetical protein